MKNSVFEIGESRNEEQDSGYFKGDSKSDVCNILISEQFVKNSQKSLKIEV